MMTERPPCSPCESPDDGSVAPTQSDGDPVVRREGSEWCAAQEVGTRRRRDRRRGEREEVEGNDGWLRRWVRSRKEGGRSKDGDEMIEEKTYLGVQLEKRGKC